MAAAAANGGLLLKFHSSSSSSNLRNSNLGFLPKNENRILVKKKRKQGLETKYPAMKASMAVETDSIISSKKLVKDGVDVVMDLPVVVKNVAATALRISRLNVRRRKDLAAQTQMFVEKGILNCRFFTLAAVAGSVIGSILCFLEGCFLILQSFFKHLPTASNHMDDGETMHLLIEALDMYLLGTGMLNFGFGVYVMFVGSRGINTHATRLHQMIMPSGMGRKWLSQAKTKLGHAVVMLLQAGTVEKFKNVPLATGFDLACFAGAILFSSACLFLLSRRLQSPSKLKEREEKEEGISND